jgi:hypothetical protein
MLSEKFPQIVKDVSLKEKDTSFKNNSGEIVKFDSEKMRELNKYPEIMKFCYSPTYNREINIGEYLSIDDNIVLRFNDTYTGYRRLDVLNHLMKKKTYDMSILPDGNSIYYSEISRFENKFFKIFKIKSTGLKNIKDLSQIYNVIPYGVSYLKGK